MLLVFVRPDALQGLVDGVGMRENMKRRFPVGMLVRRAETRDAQGRRIGERAAEIGWRCPRQDRRLHRLQNGLRLVAEEGGGKLCVARPALAAPGSSEKAGQFRG